MSTGRERWHGVYPATVTPFNDDLSIDTEGLEELGRWLVGVDGVSGLVCNGHAGEVGSLDRRERAEVVSVLARATGRDSALVSGISSENTREAVQFAEDARDAGATGLLVMPCHSWLRFGRHSDAAVEYFRAVGEVGLPIIIHQYPAWTKVSYSLTELLRIAEACNVVAVKMGERDIATFERHVRNLRRERPDVSLLTCHDEYLLATFVYGVDGALVGFGSIVPELVCALYAAVTRGDLTTAQELNDRLYHLKRAIYGDGEPSGEAHARGKEMLRQIGQIKSSKARPPVLPLDEDEIARISAALDAASGSDSSVLLTA